MDMAFIKVMLMAGLLFCFPCNMTSSRGNFSPARINMVKSGIDNLWVDKTPITFLDYLEFIYAVKNDKFHSSMSLKELAPDTSGIKNLLCNKNIKRDNLPAVGISRKQAEEYCKFRDWAIRQVFDGKLPAGKFRLLTADEASKIHSIAVNSGNCLQPVLYNSHKVEGLFSGADEWLADKVIIRWKIINAQAADKYIGFRCALEY